MSYQVFISFKNTDNGQKTKDCEIAEKLYAYLTQKEVNVFFSNVSLMEFGEAAYKDAIDDALDEVNIMVVIGTTPEFLSSRWCKYEWQSYQQNILSNIVHGNIVTYIGSMNRADVPTAIRHYQSFNLDADPIEKIGEFVIRALEKIEPTPEATEPAPVIAPSQETVENEFVFRKKEGSAYSPTMAGEIKRLALQGELTYQADAKPLGILKEQLQDRERICILDVGCGYGRVARGRFSEWNNVFVLGIDNEEKALEKARVINEDLPNFVYEKVDINSPDFVQDIEAVMDKYDIEGFDLIFGAYILQHIKDPIKFLQRSRQLLKPDGYVMYRNTADKSTISFGDNGLVRKIQDKTEEAPGNPSRDLGIQLYHHLYTTGYKNIKVYGYFKDISNMGYDERMAIFQERFGFRNLYFKKAHEENPADITMKNNYEWMKYALDKLEEIFGDQSFWYGETILNVVATKK